MKPSPEDVEQLVAALFAVSGGLERARRRIPDAGALAVLYLVAARQRVRPSEIAAELGVHQSSVARQVRILEDAGRVAITPDPDDRRSCFIALTDAGREELERLRQVGLGRFASFVAEWDADDVRTLTRLLSKFADSKREVARREQRPSGRRWQRAGTGAPGGSSLGEKA
jgi:DNA-binding MarR family transcriptional regulator